MINMRIVALIFMLLSFLCFWIGIYLFVVEDDKFYGGILIVANIINFLLHLNIYENEKN